VGFGPALLGSHSYRVTHPTIGMLLAIFLVIQVAFIWMAQLPEGAMKMDRRTAHL
jgi:exosortase/archaeosortase